MQRIRALFRSDAVGLDVLITEHGLVLAESDTGDITAVVFSCVGGEGTPTAAYVKETIFRLEVKFRANETEFVVLKFFEGGVLVSINDNTGGIDHAVAKEPEMGEDERKIKFGCGTRTIRRSHHLLGRMSKYNEDKT
jgi:hypothetical protein